MKKKFILFPFIAVLFYVVLSSNASGPGSGSIPTDATVGGCSCHNASPSSGTTVSIQLKNGATPVTTYVPGNSYTITVTGTQTDGSVTLPRFGFQAEVVQASTGTTAGTLTAPIGTHTVSPAGVVLVEHSSALIATTGGGGVGTTYVVNIPWTAPTAGSGGMTLRGVVNAVNYNGTNDGGDRWNNTTAAVNELLVNTGTASVCVGTTTTLSNSTTGGGTWSTASGAVTISGTTSSSAVITGMSAATATVTYTAGGNIKTTVVTVNANPTITGTATVCLGGTTTLTGAPTGGTWSGAGSIASVSSSGVVSGLAVGTADITYTLGTGCRTIRNVTVTAIPPISGTMTVCEGGATTLSNASSGGTWSTASSSIATVGLSSGIVTGVAAGTTTVTYTVSTGCSVTAIVTVSASPAAIGGTLAVCAGSTTTLSNSVTGGTWASSDGSRATIGASTGIVSGIAAGTSTISYTISTGCRAISVLTVNAVPAVITGSSSVCSGLTATLGNAVAGGTWTSSDGTIATIDASSGIVTGGIIGSATITYTLPGGCFTTFPITVSAVPGAISGTLSVCPGTTSALSNAITGGTWSSSDMAVATIGTSSGIVTGVTAGTSTITYTRSAGCFSTATITVDPLPSVITGTAVVCAGSTTTLSSATGGGTWLSSSANASIDAGGVVTGVTAGTSVVTYTLSTGCSITTIVTVNPIPAAISGVGTMCAGLTTTLSDATGGGTWSSAGTGTATVGATSGIVTGVSAGTTTMSYILTATGCYNTTIVTVNALPAAITGSSSVCVASSITLSDPTTGGTWSSASGSVSVGASSGEVTGVSAGTATITYTLPTTCRITTIITVNPLPAPLTGSSTVCVGSDATVIAPTGGGTWISGNTAAATISAVGILTGVAPGTSIITYTLPTGCARTMTATVNSLPAVTTGTAVVCVASTTTLSNSTLGGSWSSSSTAVATVGATTGVVTGVASGTVTITYTLPTGCVATSVVTVNPLPSAGAISGPGTLCAGSTITLSSAAAGTWNSSNASIATISASGVVSGVSPGTATISYTASNSCGTAIATKVVTVTLTASAGTISGPGTVCTGGTSTLTSSAGGGTWSSSNASVATVVPGTGVVSGATVGTATISYSVTGSCGSAVATATITVNAAPAAISGFSSVCEGLTITLTNSGGGTWMSSDASVATIGSSSGIVTGVSAGTASITYTIAGGCTAAKTVTVNPVPSPISGALSACVGTTTPLINPTPGGLWSSSNIAVATIGAATGVVSSVSAGTSTISYILSTGCASTATVTVNVTPAPITGTAHTCVGTSTTLSNSTGGGTWSSSNVLVAIASGTSGVVTGTSAGTTTITYSLPTGCYRTLNVTVDATPSAITGSSSVCTGRLLLLTNANPGGTWSSSNTAVATASSLTGVVTGVAPGTSNIIYTLPTGCSATLQISVNSSPATIAGSPSVCSGSATTLASATAGGTWSSSNPSVAGVVTTSGVVVPVSLGTSVISYTISNGCSNTVVVTVNPLPSTIIGTATVCTGASTTLSDGTTGGTWSSSNPSVAIVSPSLGSVLGVSSGTSMISYTLSTGCATTTVVTVNPAPGAITGASNLCTGAATTLGNSIPGGTWASSNTTVATVGTVTGIISGLTSGSTTITYTLPTGCMTTLLVTVNPMPAAITGSSSVCSGSTITLHDVSTGGIWSSSSTSIATVGSTSGVVAGVSPGVVNITYAMPTGCSATKSITVSTPPVAGSITGSTSVCTGASITLTDPVPGGTWSASNGHATVTGSGEVTGVSGGVDTIMYSVTSACGTATATYPVVVTGLPDAGTISGLLNICVGRTAMLTSSGGAGIWSTSNANASISVGGIVTGIAAGTDTVSFTVTNACGTAVATAIVTVLAPANAGTVTGAATVCPGSTIHLSNTVTGGIWAAGNVNATVSPTGDVTGVFPGTVSVMYIVITSCNVDTAAHLVVVKTEAECINSVNPSAVRTEELKIYPNPSSGSFAIELPESVSSGEMTITDVTGKVVSRGMLSNTNGDRVVMAMPDVASGAYLVRIDSDGRTFRKTLLIVK